MRKLLAGALLAALTATACAGDPETATTAVVTAMATTTSPPTTPPPTTAAQATTTEPPTTTAPPPTTDPTTIPPTTAQVSLPPGMTEADYAEWQQNYDEVIEVAARNRQAWIDFTRDPASDELRDAYLADLVDPLLTAANEAVDHYRSGGYFNEPGEVDRHFVIEPLSVAFDGEYASASADLCEIDGDRFLQAAADGATTLVNDDFGRRIYRLEFLHVDGVWRLDGQTKISEVLNETEC